jgi:hypothetical protein
MSFDITLAQGVGSDNLEDSSALPIIRILQDQSPEINKRKDKYIEGAEAGDLYWNSEQRTLERPLKFIPVKSVALYTEWVPKDEGGGLVAIHNLDIVNDSRYKKDVKRRNDEWLGDHELKYTRYWMILAHIDGEWQKAMLAMTSTQLKVARELSRVIKSFKYESMPEITPPIFARSFELSTVVEKNAADQEYFNFTVKPLDVLDFDEDKELLEQSFNCFKEASEALPSPGAVAAPATLPVASEAEPF